MLIVLGKIDAHTDMHHFIPDWLEKGYYPDDTHLRVVSEKFYGLNPTVQRDEAIRSTSIMIGMLMLAAIERGISTAPIIGFRPADVIEKFKIPDNYMPVMLLSVGYELDPMPERVKRLPYDVITAHETFDFPEV